MKPTSTCVFIVNPNSGKRDHLKSLTKLQRHFENKISNVKYVVTSSRDEAIKVTRQLVDDGAKLLVSVGGDGTFNAVVNGVLSSSSPNVSLLFAKGGTGQDYYRSIIAPLKSFDWKKLIYDHRGREVDAVEVICADDTDDTNVYFVNIASLGMISQIVSLKEELPKWVPSGLKYIYPTIKTISNYLPQNLEITVDGICHSYRTLVVSIAKGQYAGGGMRFARNVDLSDGKLEITIISAMSIGKMFLNLGKMYSGSYDQVDGIVKLWGKEVIIKSERPLQLEFDGELGKTSNMFKFRTIPNALKVCVPIQ